MTSALSITQGILAALFGLCIGSFLGVVIHRVPRGESLVAPGSQCPHCRHPLAPRDLVPVASYFFLRGRCRNCKAEISPRYAIVESVTAALYVLCFLRFGWTLSLVAAAALCSALVACVFVDLDRMIVLDEVLIAGGIAAIVMNGFFSALCGWQDMLIGVVAGAGPLAAIALLARLVTGKKSMGGGDIKLMAMAGTFLGWQNALLSLAFASVGGGLVLIVLLLMGVVKRDQQIPFVPMLAGGVALAMFFGQPLLTWYFGLFS